jgi:hypothetical protein
MITPEQQGDEKAARVVVVPDIPGPWRQLCWKQSQAMVRCDRKQGHQGPHTWETVTVEASEAQERQAFERGMRYSMSWDRKFDQASADRGFAAFKAQQETSREDEQGSAPASARAGDHGKTCPKAPHSPFGGYMHAEDDDRPYYDDEVRYCGRCHHVL